MKNHLLTTYKLGGFVQPVILWSHHQECENTHPDSQVNDGASNWSPCMKNENSLCLDHKFDHRSWVAFQDCCEWEIIDGGFTCHYYNIFVYVVLIQIQLNNLIIFYCGFVLLDMHQWIWIHMCRIF